MAGTPGRVFRGITLTPKGKKAADSMPRLTWDDVVRMSNGMGTLPRTSAPRQETSTAYTEEGNSP